MRVHKDEKLVCLRNNRRWRWTAKTGRDEQCALSKQKTQPITSAMQEAADLAQPHNLYGMYRNIYQKYFVTVHITAEGVMSTHAGRAILHWFWIFSR
jgi:hypothetical protein